MGIRAIESDIADFSNWLVLWSVLYLVTLSVLYAFIYNWIRRMERTCPCSAGWHRNFIKAFPLAALIFNLAMVLIVSMVLVSGSTIVRMAATVLNFLSVGSFAGWAVYTYALYKFTQQARSGGCICATSPRGYRIAVWTLAGQACHMVVSMLFGILVLMVMNDVRRQYVVNILQKIVPGSSGRILHYKRD